MSNTLADFADHDVVGRKAVVDQILAIRQQWKDIRYELAYGQPRRPERPAKPNPRRPTTATSGLSQAEIKLELQKIRVNISKQEAKLEQRPDHSKAPVWQQELARLQAIKNQYDDQLRLASYE